MTERKGKNVAVPFEVHRQLKIISANTGLTVPEALAKFGGPGIGAEFERQMGAGRAPADRAPKRAAAKAGG